MILGGVERNWKVAGLTDDNHVILEDPSSGVLRETTERPSDFWGVAYLTRSERGILRRGVTSRGRDRERPR